MEKDTVPSDRKPILIVVAGPNGSGKTTITSKILHHQRFGSHFGYFRGTGCGKQFLPLDRTAALRTRRRLAVGVVYLRRLFPCNSNFVCNIFQVQTREELKVEKCKLKVVS